MVDVFARASIDADHSLEVYIVDCALLLREGMVICWSTLGQYTIDSRLSTLLLTLLKGVRHLQSRQLDRQ